MLFLRLCWMSYAGAVRRLLLLLFLCAPLVFAQGREADRLLNSALEAQQRGDLPTAIRDYEKVLQLNPKLAEARVNLGAALADSGRFDDAIAQYRRALPDMPDKSAVQLNIGLAYYKKGDLASASREFEELHKLKPDNAQIAILLGDSDTRRRRGSDAVAMLTPLEAANASNPDFQYVLGTALIQAGRRRDGAQKLDALAQQTQNADAYLLAGSTFLDLNDYEHARSDLEAALRLKPGLPHIYTLVGMARDDVGDQTAAEEALREALRQDPNDFNANLYLGSILYKRRAMDEAKPYLDRALALNPSSSMARYEVAIWNSKSGNYADAATELEQVTRSDPKWLEPHVELANVYYRLHRPQDGAKERAIVTRLTAEQQSKGPGVP
jgi:tetratricopeptide (TPR) repeat protein